MQGGTPSPHAVRSPRTVHSLRGHAAVLFDADGTLVDTEELGFEALLAQAATCGPVAGLDARLRALKGAPMPRTLAEIAAHLGRALPPDFEASARARMAALYAGRLRPVDGAAALLHSLHAHGVPFCVASNGPGAKMDLTLAVTGLAPLLAGRVFSGYDLGLFKPDPALFVHAARALGVAPAQCAVVEDSDTGVRAGLAAGMTVYLLDPDRTVDAALRARVVTVDSLHELAA